MLYRQLDPKAYWELKEKTFEDKEDASTFISNISENVAVKNISIQPVP
tara:strand:+ start:3508 stop:3651 length:144 start_codon:yes stop_codon:yes gene_type:complete